MSPTVCFRRGTAKNTPKNAILNAHSNRTHQSNLTGSGSIFKAGMMPTKPEAMIRHHSIPPAKGIVAVATAVV